MALIDDVKNDLRIKSASYNSEITELIESAGADLVLSGVLQSKIDTISTLTPDTLIVRAIKLYCKANFGLDNADSEKYQAAYTALKMHLTLSQEYTVAEVV